MNTRTAKPDQTGSNRNKLESAVYRWFLWIGLWWPLMAGDGGWWPLTHRQMNVKWDERCGHKSQTAPEWIQSEPKQENNIELRFGWSIINEWARGAAVQEPTNRLQTLNQFVWSLFNCFSFRGRRSVPLIRHRALTFHHHLSSSHKQKQQFLSHTQKNNKASRVKKERKKEREREREKEDKNVSKRTYKRQTNVNRRMQLRERLDLIPLRLHSVSR